MFSIDEGDMCLNSGETCDQRPSKGETEHGLYRQVVLFRWFLCSYSINKGFSEERPLFTRWSLFRGRL